MLSKKSAARTVEVVPWHDLASVGLIGVFPASPVRASASTLTPPTDATRLTRRQVVAAAG
jgi:hypothetical protein